MRQVGPFPFESTLLPPESIDAPAEDSNAKVRNMEARPGWRALPSAVLYIRRMESRWSELERYYAEAYSKREIGPSYVSGVRGHVERSIAYFQEVKRACETYLKEQVVTFPLHFDPFVAVRIQITQADDEIRHMTDLLRRIDAGVP